MENIPRYNLTGEKTEIKISADYVFSCNMHSHTYYELLLYEPFNGNAFINGTSNAVKSPTVVLITPSDLHKTTIDWKDERKTAKFIKIQFEAYCVTSVSLPQSAEIYPVNEENRFVYHLFNEIYNQKDDIPYCKQLLNTLVFSLTAKNKNKSAVTPQKKHILIARAVQIIDSSFRSPISLESVAAELYVTTRYLSKIFSEQMNMGFKEYLIEKRLSYAASLLRESDASITDVCFASGFGDLSHFIRSFKAKFGITPGKYNL